MLDTTFLCIFTLFLFSLVSPTKRPTLVNFDLEVNGVGVSRVDHASNGLPYVRTKIDIKTLNLGKDMNNHKDTGALALFSPHTDLLISPRRTSPCLFCSDISNGLTVEYSWAPSHPCNAKSRISFPST